MIPNTFRGKKQTNHNNKLLCMHYCISSFYELQKKKKGNQFNINKQKQEFGMNIKLSNLREKSREQLMILQFL